MTIRATVLSILNIYVDGMSTTALAAAVGAPAPSVRRCIGELRNLGYNILREGKRFRLVPRTAGI